MPALIPPAAAVLAALALGVATALPVAGQSRPPDEVSSPARARYDAIRALREGRYAEVLELTHTLAADPDVLLVRGRALVAIGRYDEAATAFAASLARAPLGDAQLELGQLQLLRGRTAEARRLLEPVVAAAARSDEGEVLGRAARAAYRLGRYEQANTLFRDAAALIGDDAALQIAWGELFLDKQNRSEAVRSFRAALQSDRRNATAFAGLARAFADESSATARELVARALSLNPALVPAFLVLADLALDEDHRDQARTAVEQALAVNPSSLEALSRKAAIAMLEDRTADFDALVASVLAINPRYGDVYRIAGAQAARHYRFDAAASLARKALEIEPGNVRASADLGVHLLRTGDEAGARTALDTAFRADPYDVVTYNLLGLLDSLERFETVEDGVVTMRLHPDEAPVLREHALPLARTGARHARRPIRPHDRRARAGRDLPQARRLRRAQRRPARHGRGARRVLRPRRDARLAARAAPRHVQLAGDALARDGPRHHAADVAQPHPALAHRGHLGVRRAARASRVGARDGTALRRRPRARRGAAACRAQSRVHVGRDDRAGVLRSVAAGRPPGDDARRAGDAGARAGVCRRSVGGRGHAAGDWADAGRDRARVCRVCHRALRRGARRAARPGRHPPHGPDAARDDRARWRRSIRATSTCRCAWATSARPPARSPGAYEAWERAAYLLPSLVGDDSPLGTRGRLWPRVEARPIAPSTRSNGCWPGTTPTSTPRGGWRALVDPAREPARAARAWDRVAEIDPFDATASAALGRHALDSSAPDVAARWFRTALAAGPVDKAAAHCDLAESYLAVGKAPQARRQVLAALEVAPSYARAQDLLLTLVDGGR